MHGFGGKCGELLVHTGSMGTPVALLHEYKSTNGKNHDHKLLGESSPETHDLPHAGFMGIGSRSKVTLRSLPGHAPVDVLKPQDEKKPHVEVFRIFRLERMQHRFSSWFI